MTSPIYDRRKVVPLADSTWARADALWDGGHLDKAERLFKAAAAMGNVHSMNSLGTLLDRAGRSREAIYWYKRAVTKGYAMAAWNLAMHYVPLERGRWYRHWLLKAAAMGDQDAQIEVAKLTQNPEYMTKLPIEDCE